ncbi:MAG TPA: cache domain-containing protein [Candidatus Syntrophosphaera sp.]|nr:cache domain-containing protein [Candidatus Syntrophosphaera sp.]
MKHVILGLVLLVLMLQACSSGEEGIDLSAYKYNDTRRLVRFVHAAAQKMQKEGLAGLAEYKQENRTQSDYYLYVYDLQGVNIFHAGMPELENRNLREIRDKDGKRTLELVFEAVVNPENPHGWVHYTWWEPGKFYPVPKSSCHFQLRLPDGRDVIIGGGINYPLEEREFARIAVDSAVNLIQAKGDSALTLIAENESSYNFREVKVFAFKADGTILISPVLGDSLYQANLLDCTDETGHRPFQRALEQMRDQDRAWQIFLAKNRYERNLVKKTLYLRRTRMDTDTIYVGAVTDLPQTP